MKKVFYTFIFSLLFMPVLNADAECTYAERQQLMKEAKNVQIGIETVENSKDNYSFKFTVKNLTEDLFITYYNLNSGIEDYISFSNMKDGSYSFVDNNFMIPYKYEFKISSIKKNCIGRDLTKKTILKPMYNIYSNNINCENAGFSDFKYCKKFLDNDYKLTESKFYEELLKYSEKLMESEVKEQQEEKKVNYKIIGIVGISIVIFALIIFIFIKIQKKRSEL